jgi:hypothetical protein
MIDFCFYLLYNVEKLIGVNMLMILGGIVGAYWAYIKTKDSPKMNQLDKEVRSLLKK